MPNRFSLQQINASQLLELQVPLILDGVEFDQLNEELKELVDARPAQRWVLAFEKVEHTGSALLGVMVNMRHRVRANGGTLILVGLSPRLHEILRACSMERLFEIKKTREEALGIRSK